MITTGGTMGGQVARDDPLRQVIDNSPQAVEIAKDANEFVKIIGPTLAVLREQLDTDIEMIPHPVAEIDSSNVDQSLWVKLADTIKEQYDDFDSFLITHGTNTLGYTCAALSFAIANSGKPIVVTGSQVPFGLPGSDALTNLENGVRICVGQGQRDTRIAGVVAVFGSFIITGTRVKKDREFDYDAFKSFGAGAIGRIGRIINIDPDNLAKHNGYLSTTRYPIAMRGRNLRVDSGFDMRIASLTEFPGMDPGIFELLIQKKDTRGFILRAVGAGDPSDSLQEAFRMLKDRQIPIVVTTQAPNGNANFQVNEPGQWLRDNQVAIPAYDMSIEAQTAKLAWLLHQSRERGYRYGEICARMQEDLRGEVNVMWEVE
jgi:L-asparaginase